MFLFFSYLFIYFPVWLKSINHSPRLLPCYDSLKVMYFEGNLNLTEQKERFGSAGFSCYPSWVEHNMQFLQIR